MPEAPDDRKAFGVENSGLPPEAINWLTAPFARFLRIEAASGSVLLLFVISALVISNSEWGHPFNQFWETPIGIRWGSLESARSFREWISDALMTLFFLLAALELKRALVLGELRNPRLAALPILAAVGGMVVPAVIYLMLLSGQPGQAGWGTVMATDTAFVIACLALLGSRIPQSLRLFVLTLAIVDDIGAILIVAVGYGGSLNWAALALAAIGFVLIRIIALLGIRNIAIYCLLGVALWGVVDASGIHATITGVVLGIMTPTAAWVSDRRLHAILDRLLAFPPGEHWSGDTEDRKVLQMAETAMREALSPVERLELKLHPWVGFVILPLFALANAGVPLSFADFGHPVTVAVFAGLAVGKPLGVIVFSWLALRSGLALLPVSLDWTLLAAAGLLAGIGFTMSVFIAELAFPSELIAAAKLGILLASIFSALAGIVLLSARSSRARRYPN